jgi:anionic cell wall polymer biosynthesis LytR-Cps2A-Psr (LCP) family protein
MPFNYEDEKNDDYKDDSRDFSKKEDQSGRYDDRGDYRKSRKEEEGSTAGREDKDDFDEDFFKDEDFEFEDHSGEDVEQQGYRISKIREKRKRRKLLYTSLAILLIIVLVAAGIVFGYRWIKNRFFSGVEVSEEEGIIVPQSLELDQDINVMFAGSGEDLLEPDINSIIFTSYYSAADESRSLCIPVKTLMDVPGIGAELVGRSVGIGGMDLLGLTLKNGLGMDMEIDCYLLMDVSGVVDKLGGIEMELDQPYVINNYSDGSTFSLEQGTNLLDGSETLNLLKYFSGIEKDVPLEDMKIQKKVIDTIILKIVGENEDDLTGSVNLIKDLIDTDLSLEELLKLFSTFSNIEEEKNIIYTLEASSTELEGEGVVYIPDVSGLSELFHTEQAPSGEVAKTEETVDVIILNGVGTPGIANEVSALLNSGTYVYESGKNKFYVPPQEEGGIGNADNFNYAATEILVYTPDDASVIDAANELKEILGAGEITVKEGEVAASDIIIIIGADYNPDRIPEAETVEVSGVVETVILNGEGTRGLAATARDILIDHFNAENEVIEVAEASDADNYNYTQTEIIIYTDREEIEAFAQQVQQRLGVGVIKKSDNNEDDVDMTIILGSDYTSQ